MPKPIWFYILSWFSILHGHTNWYCIVLCCTYPGSLFCLSISSSMLNRTSGLLLQPSSHGMPVQSSSLGSTWPRCIWPSRMQTPTSLFGSLTTNVHRHIGLLLFILCCSGLPKLIPKSSHFCSCKIFEEKIHAFVPNIHLE